MKSVEIGDSRKDVDLARARAHVRNLQRPNKPVSEDDALIDAQILADSPFIEHRHEAGWIYLQLFMEQRQSKKRDSRNIELVTEARDIWSKLVDSEVSYPDLYLRSKFASTYTPIWTHQKRPGASFGDKRKIDRQIIQFKQLEKLGLDTLDSYSDFITRGELFGTMSEIITAGLLNRFDLSRGNGRYSLPAQVWHDKNVNNPGANFDLWQVNNGGWRKIQVKSTHEMDDEMREYDSDIALVYLEDHIPRSLIRTITKNLIFGDSNDPEIVAIAESIQASIDNHFLEQQKAA